MEDSRYKGKVCGTDHLKMFDSPLRKLFQSPKKVVGEYVNEGDTVVDIGCGPGYFSLGMAEMVGESGKVIAVDLQKEMVEWARKKSLEKGLNHRMKFHQCKEDEVGVKEEGKADFVLAFYMVHEVPDQKSFLEEVKGLLKKGGRFLLVEPKIHVTKKAFEKTVELVKTTGLKILDTPKKKGGRAILLGL